MVPSKGYFERMILQVETLFEQVSMTTITNWDQDDLNVNPGILTLDTRSSSGQQLFRQTARPYSVPLPRGSEEFRARYYTFTVCLMFMRMNIKRFTPGTRKRKIHHQGLPLIFSQTRML